LLKRLIILSFIFITVVNIYIFLNRNNYVYTKQSTYNELYPNYSGLTAHAFKLINDSTVEISVNHPGNQSATWVIKEDDSNQITYTGIYPTITVPKGLHHYKIFNTQKDSFYLLAENYTTADYKKMKLTKTGGLSVFDADFLQDSTVANLDKWRDDEIDVSADEKQAIAAIIKDSMKIISSDSSIEKIKKMGAFLGAKLFPSRGGPTDSLLSLSAFNQYRCALRGEKIWCGNYAVIFNLFAHEAGIKTRLVEIGNSRSGIPGNIHELNEYYIPEQKKWACIDLTYNNIFYKDNNNQLLNTVQVLHTNPSDSTVKVLQSQTDGSLKTVPFNTIEPLFFETFSKTNDLKFYHTLNYNESNSFF
jgi:hypothetical protein